MAYQDFLVAARIDPDGVSQMFRCKVIDTFPAFLTFWDRFRGEPLDAQIEAWSTEYMAHWPELLDRQVASYASDGLDWRQIAREKVFPH
jgi:hypothetical protein